MDAADFKKWREGLGISQQDAAKALGLTRRSIANYEGGHVDVPRPVELACAHLREHPPMDVNRGRALALETEARYAGEMSRVASTLRALRRMGEPPKPKPVLRVLKGLH